jgi:phosphate acetyltransferase/phosphate butyryltransferase
MHSPRTTFTVGETARRVRTVSMEDIESFAALTGDSNPVHLDPAYAATTRFGGVIAHGLIAVSHLGAVLGTELPGVGAVYLGHQLKFLAPVRPGDSITAVVTVKAWDPEKRRILVATEVFNQDGVQVVDGEATLSMPRG